LLILQFLDKSAKNPNLLHPQNFQIMPIREMKFPFLLLKKIFTFQDNLIDSESDYKDSDVNIFTVLEDDMA